MKKRKILLIIFILMFLCSLGYVKYHNMNINDIGLKVFSWVKILKGEAVDLNALNHASMPTMKHEDWSTLLQKHVTETGKVNYKGFINDSTLLEKYLSDLTQHPPGNNWSEEEQLAYWINAYNAFTVKLIIDHYPLKSIKDIADGLPMISSPWDIKFFKIGNIDFDLNTIEHEILRKQFKEPRVHFAINCASISCPKLRNEAFTARQLEAQLKAQTLEFINDTEKNKIREKEVKLSKIFDWFKSDFIQEQTLYEYLQEFTPIKLVKNLEPEYMEYNWNLNE